MELDEFDIDDLYFGAPPATARPAVDHAEPDDGIAGEDLFDFALLDRAEEPNEPDGLLPSRGTPAASVEMLAPAPTAAPPARAPIRTDAREDDAPEEGDFEAESETEEAEEVLALAPRVAGEARGRAARRVPLWLVLFGTLTLNLTAFVVFWQTGRTFHAGLQALRADLTGAEAPPAGAQTPAADPSGTAPATAGDPATAGVDPALLAPAVTPAPPLESLERANLEIARQEIANGAWGAARRRLHRLLAQADRMDAAVRAEVEPLARYLIAESYGSQASAKEADAR